MIEPEQLPQAGSKPATPSLTPEQEMQKRYRNVFGSAEGKVVLGDIINNLGHVFDSINPNDPVMAANKNFALTIGRMAGAFDQLYSQLEIGSRKE